MLDRRTDAEDCFRNALKLAPHHWQVSVVKQQQSSSKAAVKQQ
jgi:hypothetical protein